MTSDAAGIEAALAAWFSENLTHENFRKWSDQDFARALLPVVTQAQAEAWDKGFKQGGPMHDVNYDDPDAHTRNPYRARADESGAR